ncbi:hypothetical protein [Gluconobacter wancherniae]|uniref:hypothetical protein n=1 Tax=Gluconobacter wancherniae TaxID=1307955 RepID=UPI001B8BEEF8|nr:hypothetical protein [Gluconobacter wancherniae]MBS1089938.1 hypothetical protein [Gluconobacter wancherniae]
MSNDFIEQKRMAGQKGGIASGNNRKIKAMAKIQVLCSMYDFASLSLSQKNALCKRVFGTGLGNTYLSLYSRGQEFLFNSTDRAPDIFPTQKEINRAQILYSQVLRGKVEPILR